MSDCSTHRDEFPGVKRIIVHFTDPNEHDFEWPFVPLEREIAYIMVDGEMWYRGGEDGAVPATEENMAKFGWVRERTCHIEGSYYDELFDETCTNLSCGHAIWQNESPNYCSECGAKVVGE